MAFLSFASVTHEGWRSSPEPKDKKGLIGYMETKVQLHRSLRHSGIPTFAVGPGCLNSHDESRGYANLSFNTVTIRGKDKNDWTEFVHRLKDNGKLEDVLMDIRMIRWNWTRTFNPDMGHTPNDGFENAAADVEEEGGSETEEEI
jgi:hypothetical protein